ncbi:MAG: hypothetical protein IPN53_14965 [Comamonadaceae bacterium]|nr:hypothetical protein [Comamonadaceae bacterium]
MCWWCRKSPISRTGSCVNLVGDRLPEADIKAIEQRLPQFGLADVKLLLVQSGQIMPDMNIVKRDLINELLQTNRADIAEREERIVALQGQLQALRQSVEAHPAQRHLPRPAQFPQALQVNVTTGFQGWRPSWMRRQQPPLIGRYCWCNCSCPARWVPQSRNACAWACASAPGWLIWKR